MTEDYFPSDYSIPHDSWRTHQLETVHWTENLDTIGFCEQSTGSGKSAVVVAQAGSPVRPRRTMILTMSKSLQLQYGNDYGAHILMGRGNYPCLHPERKIPSATAEECLFANISMQQCKYYDSETCPYSQAKERAMVAPLVCTNYAYWLSSSRIRSAGFEFLALDECHLLPDVTLNWSGVEINERARVDWGLEKFPRIEVANLTGIGDAIRWLEFARMDLRKVWSRHNELAISGDEQARKLARKCERLGYRIKAVGEALQANQDAWFIKSGPGKSYYRGRPQPGIVIRPLTARFHFGRLFYEGVEVFPATMMMSATIGDFETFAEELGIGEYQGRKVPSRFPPSARKVYVLDVPKLNYKSSEADYNRQADMIAGAIKLVDSSWSGIVHVTRKKEASLLTQRLANRGLDGRMWTPPIQNDRGRYLGTQDQMRLWNERREAKTDSIMTAWQFWAGYDGREEKICIAAKTPFPWCKKGSYEEQRMKYSHKFYNQRTAWELMQSLGRTRRGREEDYDLDGEINGLVAIADRNYERVKKYLSDDFVESLAEL